MDIKFVINTFCINLLFIYLFIYLFNILKVHLMNFRKFRHYSRCKFSLYLELPIQCQKPSYLEPNICKYVSPGIFFSHFIFYLRFLEPTKAETSVYRSFSKFATAVNFTFIDFTFTSLGLAAC